MTKESPAEDFVIPKQQIIKRTAAAVGLGESTVRRYLKRGQVVETPDKRRASKGQLAKLDNCSLDIVRQVVYEFYSIVHAPTATEILKKVKGKNCWIKQRIYIL